MTEKIRKFEITKKDLRGQSHIEFIEKNGEIQKGIVITYVPFTKKNRPCVVKLPINVLEQLTNIPTEMQGIPIETLIEIANEVKDRHKQQINIYGGL